MKKSERLIYILNLLASRRTVDIATLAELCNVSQRSIYRDIAVLCEASVPIYYDDGYRLRSDASIPPVNLSVEEYLTLRTALESSPIWESPFRDRAVRVLTKLSHALGDRIPESVKRQTSRLRIQPTMTDEITERMMRIFRKIETAVGSDRVISITYESPDLKEVVESVDPYFIVFRRHAFYLVAKVIASGQFRTFRISRIQKAVIDGPKFKRDETVTIDHFFANSLEGMVGEEVRVKVRFTGNAARLIASSRHHPNEKKELLYTGDVLYRVTTSGLTEIALWLRRFGAEAAVIEPDDLRQDLARFYEEAAVFYRE